MIVLGVKTRLTTEAERLMVEIGGGNPRASLTRERLSNALSESIRKLAKQKSPILLKIYREYERKGMVPSLDSLADPVDSQ